MFVARILANTSAVLLVLLSYSNLLVQQQTLASTSREQNCDPIGRVLSGGDRTLPKGSLLCKGDRLSPSSGKIVKILCYQNQKVLQLGKGAVDDSGDKCVPQTIGMQQCTPQSRSKCPKPKNPGSDEPTIISPYSSLILNPRPSIRWNPVGGATSYVVIWRGEGVSWSKVVKATELAYSREEKALSVGTTYKLTIIANSGDSPVSASYSAVNMLPSSTTQQITSLIKQIQSLKLSPDEEARDLDSVYMSQKLLTDAIEVLKARVDANTTNPTIYRLLGDRYLEAGLPADAEKMYIEASALAQSADNANELAASRTGLERSKLAQQP
ncbi:tetratricopeptide repeat protein [Pelatocladus sp. BLCC-F211]|uniref:tetratricopeptide repeat protein n=1 Tax=Pelatocladus sp. BLCC-F211 TaxID=3342752 RepID=UPI0035B8E593